MPRHLDDRKAGRHTEDVTKELTEVVWTRIDVPLKRDLEARAKADDRSTAAVVRQAIRSYLQKGKR